MHISVLFLTKKKPVAPTTSHSLMDPHMALASLVVVSADIKACGTLLYGICYLCIHVHPVQ